MQSREDAILEISTPSSRGLLTIPAGMRRAMDAFEGAAEEAGVKDEDDIAAFVREARADMYAEAVGASERG